MPLLPIKLLALRQIGQGLQAEKLQEAVGSKVLHRPPLATGLDHGETEADIGHEMPIHDIEVQDLRPGLFQAADLAR